MVLMNTSSATRRRIERYTAHAAGFAAATGMIACALLVLATQSFAATGVGSTSLVLRNVEGVLLANKRQLETTDPVYQDETVSTGDRSASEIVFLDETRLTVGPNSKVVLDSFVFDAAAGTGTLAVEMAEGVFRFVSGKLPGESYKVVTPLVSIGMRGTVFDFLARPGGSTAIVQRSQSEVFVETVSGQSATLDRPGMTAIAFASGRLVLLNEPPDWVGWRVDEMSALVATGPWSPPSRNPAGATEGRESGESGEGSKGGFGRGEFAARSFSAVLSDGFD